MIDVMQHIPLVKKIAGKFYKKFHFRYEYEELFQVGCVGLMKAIDKFDESKGYKFITYAYPQVWGAIHNYIRDDSWYMAERCRERIRKSYPPETLDICLTETESDTLKERLPYEESGYEKVELGILIENLPLQLRAVLILEYVKCLGIKEIEHILGVSHEVINKRRKKALNLLRKELEA